MAPSPLQQRRTHNTLLFQKLLNLRDGASPFTLVLDTLEQSGRPVIREFAKRAKISKSKIMFISFSTLRKKVGFETEVFISANGKTLPTLRTEILKHLPPPSTTPSTVSQKTLLMIDTLNPLSANPTTSLHLSTFLSSLLLSPSISLLATYHLDIPLPIPFSSNSYSPDPLTILTYLATAILRTASLSHTISRKKARDRSLQDPEFGLAEGREGVLVGLKGEKLGECDGAVVEMEIRRKSGRGVVETFVLSSSSPSTTSQPITAAKSTSILLSNIILLDEHPLYASAPSGLSGPAEKDAEEVETTFNLGLTEKQKRDREGVVLPYFDAQREGGTLGAGEGGRILYEMGAEDREDFDDEEDEI